MAVGKLCVALCLLATILDQSQGQANTLNQAIFLAKSQFKSVTDVPNIVNTFVSQSLDGYKKTVELLTNNVAHVKSQVQACPATGINIIPNGHYNLVDKCFEKYNINTEQYWTLTAKKTENSLNGHINDLRRDFNTCDNQNPQNAGCYQRVEGRANFIINVGKNSVLNGVRASFQEIATVQLNLIQCVNNALPKALVDISKKLNIDFFSCVTV